MRVLLLLAPFMASMTWGVPPTIQSSALTMVPQGKTVLNRPRELTVKTRAGTKVKLEFERKGDLEEASGLNLGRGDELEPGHGIISLSTAAQSLTKKGLRVRGEWNLEKDKDLGWVYELMEETDDSVVVHTISAQTGRYINSTSFQLTPALSQDEKRSPGPKEVVQ